MMKRCMLQNMPKNGKKTKTNWSRIVFAAFSKAQSNNVLRCLTKHCHRHNLSSFRLMIATNQIYQHEYNHLYQQTCIYQIFDSHFQCPPLPTYFSTYCSTEIHCCDNHHHFSTLSIGHFQQFVAIPPPKCLIPHPHGALMVSSIIPFGSRDIHVGCVTS